MPAIELCITDFMAAPAWRDHWVHRFPDCVPVIGRKDPRGQIEVMQYPRPIESPREQSEIGIIKLGAPAKQTDGDKGIPVGKKKTAEPSTIWYWAELRHGARICSGDAICQ